MKLKALISKAAAVAVVAALAGCNTFSQVNPDGTADSVTWPAASAFSGKQTNGIFPTPEALSQIRSGMTKDQLYHLLGVPHYSELWNPTEWNYVFYFNTPGRGTDNVSTCQFKVLFDKDKIAQNFYWNPIDPENGSCPPVSPTAKKYSFDADALFAFDSSALTNNDGREQLERFAEELSDYKDLSRIYVTGHTDRLGEAGYNQNLSQKRAETVRAFLVEKGLPSSKIYAIGLGSTQPVKLCDDTNREDLITCLQPNRRVEVRVEGAH